MDTLYSRKRPKAGTIAPKGKFMSTVQVNESPVPEVLKSAMNIERLGLIVSVKNSSTDNDPLN